MKRALVAGLGVLLLGLVVPTIVLAQGNVEKGKTLYAQSCVACHGATGKGDGPGAAALNPKPKDFTDKAYMAGLKDQYLFDIIRKGGAALGKSPLMPPASAALKDGDIRDVVAFLRSLAK
jgi:mono/diheme cytochrome c family protein